MAATNLIKQKKLKLSYLKEALDYDCVTGVFTWKKHKLERMIGKTAGHVGTGSRGLKRKTHRITINGDMFLAHRLAYFYHHGVWPNQIDHVDGNPLNNAISNLRSVSHLDNQKNRATPGNNVSGYTGVTFYPRLKSKPWKAVGYMKPKSKKRTKTIHLGYFKTFDEAVLARKEWEKQNNYHVNHGR